MLKPEDTAPSIETRDAGGDAFSLAGALTGGPVVLYFFPKAFTSG
jgi:peroxiredoxin